MQEKPQMNTDGHRWCGLKMKTFDSPEQPLLVIGLFDQKQNLRVEAFDGVAWVSVE
jgi:hypothetical protein